MFSNFKRNTGNAIATHECAQLIGKINLIDIRDQHQNVC